MILHVTNLSEWQQQSNQVYYAPGNFTKEGFIHCCSQEQLQGVLQRYYTGQSDLLLLQIDELKLQAPLKYEEGASGEMFPHIFGTIIKEAIEKVTKL